LVFGPWITGIFILNPGFLFFVIFDKMISGEANEEQAKVCSRVHSLFLLKQKKRNSLFWVRSDVSARRRDWPSKKVSARSGFQER
jgi:hypothetical protein